MVDVRTLRKRAGLTQEELAREAGVTGATINNIERDRCIPRKQTLERVTEVLRRKTFGILTNGDMLRRQIVSDADLVNNGKVRCVGDRTKCSRNCCECKLEYLQAPYHAAGEIKNGG